MRQAQHFEAAGQAFPQPACDQQRRRAGEHDFQAEAGGGILVPQPFDRAGPVGNLLHLVQHQQRFPDVRADQLSRLLPLLGDPVRAAHVRRVRGSDAAWQADLFRHLFRQSRFADLPRTGDDLQEPARFVSQSA